METASSSSSDFDAERVRLAIRALIDEAALTQTELAKRAGVSPTALSTFLSGREGSEHQLSKKNLRTVAKALGANGWGELYKQGTRSQQEKPFDVEQVRAAIRTLMAEAGLTQTALAEKAGVPPTALSAFLSGREGSEHQISKKNLRTVADALGANSWGQLYEQGTRAQQENPFDVEQVRAAIRALMAEAGLTQTALAQKAGVKQGNLSSFLNSTGSDLDKMSQKALLSVAKALGANGWGELYALAGMGGPRVDNGVGRVVAGLVAQGAGAAEDAPIRSLLSPVQHEGRTAEGVPKRGL